MTTRAERPTRVSSDVPVRAGVGATWDPVAWSVAYWNCCARSAEIWWTRRAGPAAIAAAAQDRLRALVRFARDRSPLYRELYRLLPPDCDALDALPIVTKPQLMPHFEQWVTDPAIRLPALQAFLDDRRHVGEQYLGRYFVWKSSGSSGVPGIFLQDADALSVYDALVLAQIDVSAWSADYAVRMAASNARAALIVATGDHFASIASWQRARRLNPALQTRSFSVLTPVPQLVAELNAYRPAFLASYPTVLCLLAEEQRQGRLHIAPSSLWSGGECLAATAHADIERVFGCPLSNEYGASECLSIAYECRAGWLHVNADWVQLEAVDADYRPVPAGVPSHTTLLTNLINRVQPIIRYDLGDSIVVNPRPCSCGNPLPAIQVAGRRDEVLVVRDREGREVQLLPMALTTVVEAATRLHRYQLVQTAPDHLVVRIDADATAEARARAWDAVRKALADHLAAQGVGNVRVTLDRQGPELAAPGGKLHVVRRMGEASA